MAGVETSNGKRMVALTRFFIWLDENLKSGNLNRGECGSKLYGSVATGKL